MEALTFKSPPDWIFQEELVLLNEEVYLERLSLYQKSLPTPSSLKNKNNNLTSIFKDRMHNLISDCKSE